MLEKKKIKLKRINIIIILVATIIVGANIAFAKTLSGTTLRGWSYIFEGNYNSNTGAVSSSTKATFTKHKGCYTEVQIYVQNGNIYAHAKDSDNYVSCNGNVGRKNSELRIYHFAHSQKDTCSVGGHTIY